MDKSVADKVKQCKALQGKTFLDVMDMPEFKDNLAVYWEQQRVSRKQVEKNYLVVTKNAPRHPIAQIMNYTVDDMIFEYVQIHIRKSILPTSVRAYIMQLCKQAYSLTVAQIVCKEFPELESVLIPKSN